MPWSIGMARRTRRLERYRLLDYEAAKEGFERDAKEHNPVQGIREPNDPAKYLQLQFTVEDEGVFTDRNLDVCAGSRRLGGTGLR